MGIWRHRVTAADVEELRLPVFAALLRSKKTGRTLRAGQARIPTPEGLKPIPIIVQPNAPLRSEGEYDPTDEEVHLNATLILDRGNNYLITIDHELDHARTYAFSKSWQAFADYDVSKVGDTPRLSGTLRLQRAIRRTLERRGLIPYPFPPTIDTLDARAKYITRRLVRSGDLEDAFARLRIEEEQKRPVVYELLLIPGLIDILERGLGKRARYFRDPGELHAFANTIYLEVVYAINEGRCAPKYEGSCIGDLILNHSPSYEMIAPHISDEERRYLAREVGKTVAKMLQLRMV